LISTSSGLGWRLSWSMAPATRRPTSRTTTN
jgi:hypothetical protein